MENIFYTSEKLQIKISGNAHSSCQVLLNTLKGTAITLSEVILYYSTLSGTNWQILSPKRYDEHPPHFYRGVPRGGGNNVRKLITEIESSHLGQKMSSCCFYFTPSHEQWVKTSRTVTSEKFLIYASYGRYRFIAVMENCSMTKDMWHDGNVSTTCGRLVTLCRGGSRIFVRRGCLSKE